MSILVNKQRKYRGESKNCKTSFVLVSSSNTLTIKRQIEEYATYNKFLVSIKKVIWEWLVSPLILFYSIIFPIKRDI